ncbi:MAG: hypothetical protein MUP21_12735, partial [Dehalococcoidia bacterium]|nr:hypothetical protein [Dehalococcoidia bacterium]
RVIPEAVTGITPERSSTAQINKVKSKSSKKAKRRKVKAQPGKWVTLVTAYPAVKYIYGTIATLIVFFLVFYPNIGMAINNANRLSRPGTEWHESLVWMRENTPDPFQDADFYYELYEKPPGREAYNYPDSAYGVLAWWDYGHWITYIAHRIPNANPHQVGATAVAIFFTSQDEASANLLIDELGSRYVIIDLAMALHEINPEKDEYGSFYAMLEWAGKEETDFFEVYYRRGESGKYEPEILYYPEYYRSMSSRLYIFDGKEWTPQKTVVISWTEKELTDSKGNKLRSKVISNEKIFANYEDANIFIKENPDYLIVGTNPLYSPIPLEQLENYKLIHESTPPEAEPGYVSISEVKIFEYVP